MKLCGIGLPNLLQTFSEEAMSENIEVLRRVHLSGEGVFLEVGDFPDALKFLKSVQFVKRTRNGSGICNSHFSPSLLLI